MDPARGWYDPRRHGDSDVAPIAETKLPAAAFVHGPRPVALNVPGAHSVLRPANVTGAPLGGTTMISRVIASVIWSIVNSRSKLPPFNSIDAPAPGAGPVRTVTIPFAGETGDSVYCRRRVSFLLTASLDDQSNVNDSRDTPLNDWVMMLAVEVGDTDVSGDGSVVVSAAVVGVEMNDPSGFVFGDAGFNVVVVGSSTGDERLVDDASVVEEAGFDEVGDVVAVESAPGVVLVGDSAGSGASTLRLLPSDEPPQAATPRRREARTRDKRFEITSKTLFSFASYGSSADEISVSHHRQA